MAITLQVLALSVLYIIQTSDASLQSCTCNVGRGKFGDCSLKNAAVVWGNHHDEDIGLYRDCLPPVPEK